MKLLILVFLRRAYEKEFYYLYFYYFCLTYPLLFLQKGEVDFEKLEYDEKTGLVYVEGEKESFTGIAKQYCEDKSLKVEFPYKNGKLEGERERILSKVVNLNLMHFLLMVY